MVGRERQIHRIASVVCFGVVRFAKDIALSGIHGGRMDSFFCSSAFDTIVMMSRGMAG